jgi:hypothetical protein
MIKEDKFSLLTVKEREHVEEVWLSQGGKLTAVKFWEANKNDLFKNIKRRVIRRGKKLK